MPSLDPKFHSIQKKQQIILQWLLDAQLSTSSAVSAGNKGLTEQEQSLLIALVHPNSEQNPWKSEDIKQRNYLIVLILLCFGLRPAELLTLRINDIKFGSISSINIQRRPHDPMDPRTDSPEVKRSGRILSILDPRVGKIINQYVVDWRYKFDDKHRTGTDFLILSEDGNPLSYISIAKIFAHIRKFEPRFPANLSAKSLRHSFSSNLENKMRMSGIDEIRRREILAYLRGDSSLESQNTYIAQAIREEAAWALSNHQTSIFSTLDKKAI